VTVDASSFVAFVLEAVGGRARLVALDDLTQAGEGLGPFRFVVETGGSSVAVVLHVGALADESAVARFALQARALEVALAHALPAPQVLAADLDGAATGSLVLLQTALGGTSRIPVLPDEDRLRTLGRAAAAIHAVSGESASLAGLPRRARSLEGLPFESLPVPDRSAALFERACHLVDSLAPQGAVGFVHGDYWQGNTLWDGERYSGAVDWDFAGVGPAGIDVGSLRCDMAVMYGPEAVRHVARGWAEAAGRPPDDLAYWDVIGCLCSPADLSYWLPNFHHQGRSDLTWEVAMDRRDAHLAAALAQFG
jgi:Ser/Thr protein kinase RdoA (MazF antagonist)